MSKHSKRGLSLLELTITVALLGLLLLLIFNSFDMGTRIFQETSVRQSTETQLRSIKVLLQRDIKLSNFWLCNAVSRPTADGSRDALSLATLSNWKDPTLYDGTTNRPLWNRYTVWYATQGSLGSLHRQVISPSFSGSALATAYGDLAANLSDTDPNSNADVTFSRVLSEGVRDFEISTRLQNGTIRAKIRLEATGLKRANSSDKTKDNLEVSLVFRPKNTWPEI